MKVKNTQFISTGPSLIVLVSLHEYFKRSENKVFNKLPDEK